MWQQSVKQGYGGVRKNSSAGIKEETRQEPNAAEG